jgi:hypothetical protein
VPLPLWRACAAARPRRRGGRHPAPWAEHALQERRHLEVRVEPRKVDPKAPPPVRSRGGLAGRPRALHVARREVRAPPGRQRDDDAPRPRRSARPPRAARARALRRGASRPRTVPGTRRPPRQPWIASTPPEPPRCSRARSSTTARRAPRRDSPLARLRAVRVHHDARPADRVDMGRACGCARLDCEAQPATRSTVGTDL